MVDASLSIHSYLPNIASVSVETTASGLEEQRSELLLLSLYAAHWIDKLSRSHRGSGINPASI
jgi:hypothetical protein